MIQKGDLCCGCRACEQRCPQQAIRMVRDREGFLAPKIEERLCIECGICRQVCPMLHQETHPKPEVAWLFYHKDEQYRKASSSAGAFEMICRAWVDSEPFSIFGCSMENGKTATHVEAQTWTEVQKMKKSKYVQSDTKDVYLKAKQRLVEGKRVIFVGTPCQVMGFRNFLNKEYTNLLTIDFVCHGTPSAMALERYIQSLQREKGQQVQSLSFRHKMFNEDTGWSSLGVCVQWEDGTQSTIKYQDSNYMIWFLEGALSNMCCYDCVYASPKRCSDITMGDFWGIEKIYPELAEKETDGVSLLLLNSNKGRFLEETFAQSNQVRWEKLPLPFALLDNRQLTEPAKQHPWRKTLYGHLVRMDFDKAVARQMYGSYGTRLKRKIMRLFRITRE